MKKLEVLIKNLSYSYMGYRTFKKLYKLGLVRKQYKFIDIYRALRDKEEVKYE